MTSPEDTLETASGQSAAVFARLVVMKTRADFVAASKARYQTATGLTVQMRDRGDDDPTVRVGFTCSKKVGNAVARNRAKRRLRAVADAVLAEQAQPGWDYVLVGRPGVTIDRPFDALKGDLSYALRKIHAPT